MNIIDKGLNGSDRVLNRFDKVLNSFGMVLNSFDKVLNTFGKFLNCFLYGLIKFWLFFSVSLGLAPTCKPNWAQQAPTQIPTCPKATPAFRYLSVCVSVCVSECLTGIRYLSKYSYLEPSNHKTSLTNCFPFGMVSPEPVLEPLNFLTLSVSGGLGGKIGLKHLYTI